MLVLIELVADVGELRMPRVVGWLKRTAIVTASTMIRVGPSRRAGGAPSSVWASGHRTGSATRRRPPRLLRSRPRNEAWANEALEQAASELRGAEIEARRNAAVLEGVGAATPNIIYVKDRDLRYVYLNPAAVAVVGRPIDEILGRRRADFVINDNVEGEHDVADREVLETGKTDTSEERFTSPDGAWRIFRTTRFALRDRDGAVIGVGGLTIDISESYASRDALAESEAKYRSIANAMPALVWSADAEGSRDFYNDRWRQFIGSGTQATEGWGWLDKVHAEDRSRVETGVRRHISSGEPYDIEYRLMGQQGLRWFLERALPVRDEGGRHPCRWKAPASTSGNWWTTA